MSFIRKKTRKTKAGKTLTYYERVESRWVNGKVRQKVLNYIGANPNRREIPIDATVAAPIAEAIISGTTTREEMKELLKKLGIDVNGRIKKLSLDYNPPLKKLTLRIE